MAEPKNQHHSLTPEEKASLKLAIMRSITVYRQRMQRVRYAGMAAAFLIVMLCAYGLRVSFTRAFVNKAMLAEAKRSITTDGEAVLLMGDERVIPLGGNHQSVQYTSQAIVLADTTITPSAQYHTIVVPYGKSMQLLLSDGTQVWLHAGTRLVYPRSFDSNYREVYLEGEAIFEVAKDATKPFLVSAEGHQVRVLGTVFSVANYAEEPSIRTVLQSGSVSVRYAGGHWYSRDQHITLDPGNQLVYDRATTMATRSTVDVQRYFAWRDGVLMFENDALETIAKQLTRFYNVPIHIDSEGLKQERFSGILDLHDQLEVVLATIAETSTFSVRNVSGSIILSQTNFNPI
jgi:transmembrane sensor